MISDNTLLLDTTAHPRLFYFGEILISSNKRG